MEQLTGFAKVITEEVTTECETYTNYPTATMARQVDQWDLEDLLNSYYEEDLSLHLAEEMKVYLNEVHLEPLDEDSILYQAMRQYLNLVNWKQLAVRTLIDYEAQNNVKLLSKEELKYF
jgi:hypothetical protein